MPSVMKAGLGAVWPPGDPIRGETGEASAQVARHMCCFRFTFFFFFPLGSTADWAGPGWLGLAWRPQPRSINTEPGPASPALPWGPKSHRTTKKGGRRRGG